MPSLDLFDYPLNPPKAPDPELAALVKNVRQFMKGRDITIITAKEGGGVINVVDTYFMIAPTRPRNSSDTWTVVHTKPRT